MYAAWGDGQKGLRNENWKVPTLLNRDAQGAAAAQGRGKGMHAYLMCKQLAVALVIMQDQRMLDSTV